MPYRIHLTFLIIYKLEDIYSSFHINSYFYVSKQIILLQIMYLTDYIVTYCHIITIYLCYLYIRILFSSGKMMLLYVQNIVYL